MNRIKRILILAAPLLTLTGCLGSGKEAGIAGTCTDSLGTQTFNACRVFRGRLQLPHQSVLGLEEGKAFQFAAVGFQGAGKAAADGGATAKPDGAAGTQPTGTVQWVLFTGDEFAADAGSGQQASIPFSIMVPCELSVNLLLQLAKSGGDVPGVQVAQALFASDSSDTTATRTLIPAQPTASCGSRSVPVDLGQIRLILAKNKALAASAITLGQGKSKNPLALLDTDNDQLFDLADADDDGDGIADISDEDADGDGIKDSAQTFSALLDVAGDFDKNGKAISDGIPDMFQ